MIDDAIFNLWWSMIVSGNSDDGMRRQLCHAMFLTGMRRDRFFEPIEGGKIRVGHRRWEVAQ
jgi:hypothetical protein